MSGRNCALIRWLEVRKSRVDSIKYNTKHYETKKPRKATSLTTLQLLDMCSSDGPLSRRTRYCAWSSHFLLYLFRSSISYILTSLASHQMTLPLVELSAASYKKSWDNEHYLWYCCCFSSNKTTMVTLICHRSTLWFPPQHNIWEQELPLDIFELGFGDNGSWEWIGGEGAEEEQGRQCRIRVANLMYWLTLPPLNCNWVHMHFTHIRAETVTMSASDGLMAMMIKLCCDYFCSMMVSHEWHAWAEDGMEQDIRTMRCITDVCTCILSSPTT